MLLGESNAAMTFRGRVTMAAAMVIFAALFVSVPLARGELVAQVEAADLVVVQGQPVAAVQQQFRAQFEPLVKVELSFVNRVCKLDDKQRLNLIGKSNAWLDKYIATYAKQGGQPQPAGVWMAGNGRQAADPRDAVQAGIGKLVKSELSQEQAALYAEESKKRAEFVKATFVENLVTRIDSELILTPDQRDKIKQSLSQHWDKSWQPQLEMFVHGMDMWPNVPDQWIRPHLSAVQQVSWGKRNRQQFGNVFFGGFPVEGQVIDDIDLKEGQDKTDDKPVAKKQAAANRIRAAREN
jgi:hypothetical protein